MPPPSPFRYLAPSALAVAVVAVLLVLSSGSGSDDAPPAARTTEARRTADGPRRTWYRVRSGDSLAAIATKHGLTVDRLRELNPNVDPQTLQAGQQLRLRR